MKHKTLLAADFPGSQHSRDGFPGSTETLHPLPSLTSTSTGIQIMGLFQTASLIPLNYKSGLCCAQVPPSCTSNNTVWSLLQTLKRNKTNRLRSIFAITSLFGSDLLTNFLTVQPVFHPPNQGCLIKATSSSLDYENVIHSGAVSFSPVHQQKDRLGMISF